MPVRAPRAAVAVLAAGACAAACTVDPGPSGPEPRAATTPPSTVAAPAPPAARVPLVVAEHPSRGRVSLRSETVQALRAGELTDWRRLSSDRGPLRTGSLRDVRRDRSIVALVPATAVGPPVAVATVDGVDPLRRPESYPLTVPGESLPPLTKVTVTGDVMLGRRVGDRLARVGDPAAALRPMAGRLAAADLTIGNLESTL